MTVIQPVSPIRILVTDDDPLGLTIITRILISAGYSVFSAINGEETLRMVEEHHPDLILLDIYLPDIKGTEICRRLKTDPRTADIFIILLSGVSISSDEQSSGLEDGADGFIARPVASRELLARIQAYMRIKTTEQALRKYSERLEEMVKEHMLMEEKLRHANDELETINLELQQSLAREEFLARTDGLTGLCNRRNFFELAAREFHAAVRYKRPLTLLMFDMDDFKQINDTFGHAAGDKLLVAVAQTATAQMRVSDVVARYGGDEFIVSLPFTNAQQAFPIAERIRSSVSAIKADMIGHEKKLLAVTLSIGIAEIRLDDPVDENIEYLIQRADEAQYIAKQSGQNRTVIFGMDKNTSD